MSPAKASSEPPGSRPEDGAGHLMVWRRVAPAVGLILLAPLVGEYLLGNAVFAAGAVVLLAAATRKVRRTKGSL
jgi:hypothetical protein